MKKLFLRVPAIALTILILFSVPASAEELPYVETLFNERNGLPTGEANDVIQTSDGYIWVGSYGGLIRYDGTNFRNFSIEGILPSSSVRTLFEDSSGRLWIGTNDAGVFVYEGGEISRPEGQPTDSFLCIRGFAEGGDGLYACSNSGIAEISGGVMTVYDNPEVSGKTIYSVGVDKFGRVWGVNGEGCCVVLDSDGNTVRTVDGAFFLGEGQSLYSTTAGVDGEIWLGSADNVLARLEFLGEGFAETDIAVTLFETEKTNTLNSLRMMDDGTLVVSGLRGAALLYPDGSMREFGENEGAASVNSAFVDYEGNIWLASTSSGIVRFSLGSYSSPDVPELKELSLNAVAVSGGKCYVGSDSGLLIYDGEWNSVTGGLCELLDGERVRDIIADSNGNIWVASYSDDNPLVMYDADTEEVTVYRDVGGRARVLLEMSNGSMAVGTQGGVSIIRDGEVAESYTGWEYPVVLSLLETDGGSLLAGSDGGGIYEIKNGSVTNHSFSDGLAEGVVLRMLKDSEGAGFFISAGSSLYYWEDGTFRKLDSLEKGAGSIFDMFQSGETLWLLQNDGVLTVDRADLLSGGSGRVQTYSFEYGLCDSLNANTRHCMADGKLYLATRSGVSVFTFQVPEGTLPKIVINDITVDGEMTEHPDEVAVSGGAQRITIDFAALSFTDTTRFAISYQLEGFDENAIVLDVDKSGQVSYTNLPGGEYCFRMKIYDPDDPGEFQECSFVIDKKKRLTEQWIFWLCGALVLALVAAGVVWLIFKARMQSIKRREQEYQSIVEQALLTFAGTIDAKDKYTNGHSTRVALYSRELARRMGASEKQQEYIYYVALLHDIGKIGIPDSVLNKPGKLTPEEREIIQQHPKIGGEILKNFTALEGLSDGAKYHHERYDGGGYCEGLAGEEIPFVARIIGVADTYDAMSSERCYRKPLSEEVILSELNEAMGTQLDPAVVPHMLDMIADGTAPIPQERVEAAEGK